MRKEYDFRPARPNPYAKRLKKAVTIRLDEPTIAYFKRLAQETAIPYQTLINLYLRQCAADRKKPSVRWKPVTSRAT
jgi:predicted DNA binding CopG/RHH family protein